jgi:hypothetical protein
MFHPDGVMDSGPESRWIEGPKPATIVEATWDCCSAAAGP